MKIYIVTYGDGFEFSGVFKEAYYSVQEANTRCDQLNKKRNYEFGGYDVLEYMMEAACD